MCVDTVMLFGVDTVLYIDGNGDVAIVVMD